MSRIWLAFILITLSYGCAPAQIKEVSSAKGRVFDVSSKMPVAGAKVYCAENQDNEVIGSGSF